MAILKRCKNCDGLLAVQPSRADRTKFCSRDCMNDWWSGKSRSPETEFQAGGMPPTAVPVGTESDATKGGYVKVKVADPDVWRLRSHIVWEETHGRAIPNGWIIRHLDGNPKNDDPGNLKAMPRSKHLIKTLADPDVLAKKKREVIKATKRRWERYREEKREEELSEYDTYYWEMA